MEKTGKIFLAGHQGLVGSNILKQLQNKGYQKIILKTRHELDLENQKQTADFFQKEKPDYVILAAAKVGGIVANNTYRADFIYKNLQIQTNLSITLLIGVKKLLFFSLSSCVYPKKAPQPARRIACSKSKFGDEYPIKISTWHSTEILHPYCRL